MIASVRGPVHHVALDHVVVEVGGVGMRVHTTPATASSCRRGIETVLSTSLVVREDALTLYGFAAVDERDMFQTLQSVSGVGPRLALAMLSVLGPDDIRQAISVGDVAALMKVPGIGRKGAERMVLELRDRVGVAVPAGAGYAPPVAGSPWRGQVTEALVGLGWSARQAGDAVERVAPDAGEDPAVAEVLRAALRELGR